MYNTHLQKLSVCLGSGKVLVFSTNSSHFHTLLHFLVLPGEVASYLSHPEKSWKNPEKSLLGQNSQTKEVQLVDFRHAFRIAVSRNWMQVAEFVSQSLRCTTKGVPAPAGALLYLCCRTWIPLKSRWGSVPHNICDLLAAGQCLLLPPISWGIVVPGHLPGSNGPSSNPLLFGLCSLNSGSPCTSSGITFCLYAYHMV